MCYFHLPDDNDANEENVGLNIKICHERLKGRRTQLGFESERSGGSGLVVAMSDLPTTKSPS